jgi:hypothetical protein
MAFKDRDEIAKRLDLYADAATAFGVLQSLAFVISLASSDVRDTVVAAGRAKVMGLWVAALSVTGLVTFLCFLGQNALLGDLEKGWGKNPDHIILYTRLGRLALLLMASILELVAGLFLFGF